MTWNMHITLVEKKKAEKNYTGKEENEAEYIEQSRECLLKSGYFCSISTLK